MDVPVNGGVSMVGIVDANGMMAEAAVLIVRFFKLVFRMTETAVGEFGSDEEVELGVRMEESILERHEPKTQIYNGW